MSTGDRINEGFFLLENVWPFCQAAKQGGRNNEVTVLQSGIRRGFTVNKLSKLRSHLVYVASRNNVQI